VSARLKAFRIMTRAGTVAHLTYGFPTGTLSVRGAQACCGREEPMTGWYGTGTQDEIDRVAALPLCRKCERDA
jgi:hypothetical protein